MLKPGAELDGRFRLVLPLGERRRGAVWQVEDLEAGETRALALREPLDGDASPVSRFVEVMSKLRDESCKHVVDVLDTGTFENGTGWAAMPMLEGVTLAERLAEEPTLSLADFLLVIAQVLDGLSALHERGVIHGDVEPGNIFLVGGKGRPSVKLIGVGLSRTAGHVCSDSADAEAAALLRSLAYASPEQVRCATTIGAATDLYSLGVVLFEALSGRLPHQGATEDELRDAILSGRPISVQEVRAEVPEALAKVIQKAMATSPRARYADAKSMQQAILSSTLMAPEAVKRAALPVRTEQVTRELASDDGGNGAVGPKSKEKSRSAKPARAEAKKSEAKQPEAKGPEANESEAKQPEGKKPKSNESEAKEPEARKRAAPSSKPSRDPTEELSVDDLEVVTKEVDGIVIPPPPPPPDDVGASPGASPPLWVPPPPPPPAAPAHREGVEDATGEGKEASGTESASASEAVKKDAPCSPAAEALSSSHEPRGSKDAGEAKEASGEEEEVAGAERGEPAAEVEGEEASGEGEDVAGADTGAPAAEPNGAEAEERGAEEELRLDVAIEEPSAEGQVFDEPPGLFAGSELQAVIEESEDEPRSGAPWAWLAGGAVALAAVVGIGYCALGGGGGGGESRAS